MHAVKTETFLAGKKLTDQDTLKGDWSYQYMYYLELIYIYFSPQKHLTGVRTVMSTSCWVSSRSEFVIYILFTFNNCKQSQLIKKVKLYKN